MDQILRFLRSPIGRKAMNALTGISLVLFLVVHLGGNMLLFKGAAEFNDYSGSLMKSWLIIGAEVGLLIVFLYHALNAALLIYGNWKARPVGYQVNRSAGHVSRKSVASTTMILTGAVVLTFIVLHLVTMKYGPGYGDEKRDLFGLVKYNFTQPAVAGAYVLATIVLGLHLWHGLGTVYESLGLAHRKGLRRLLQALALVLAGGFFVIPIIMMIQYS